LTDLTSEELTWLRQAVAGDGKYTVTWDKPQGNAVFEAIDAWFKTQIPSLYNVMHDGAPGAVDAAAKERFIKAYMQLKSLGVPKQRSAAGYYDDARDVHRELEAQTDRGAAIVGAALLDTKLETALRLCLVPGLSQNEQKDLFEGPTAPLGTFSGRMRVAHALGLVGEQSFADLRLIGRIRNRFAHKLEVTSFTDPEIAALCSKLQVAEFVFLGETPPSEPRQRFIRSVVNIVHFIYSEIVAGTAIGELPSKSP
jgi:hypothetical protein